MSRVTLTNPFDLLTDENEDRTNVSKQNQQKATAAKPAAAPAKPAVSKPAAQKTEVKGDANKPAPTNKPANENTSNSNNNKLMKSPSVPRDSNQNLVEKEKEYRAPRDKRDHPQQQGAGTDKKRAFDRKSGTGRPQNEVKKGGQGKGNWGGEVDKEGVEAIKAGEGAEEVAEIEEAKDQKVAADGEKQTEAKEGESVPAAKEEEETRTYEEFLATRKTNAPKFEAHKPRTVSDDFGDMVPVEREESKKKDTKSATEKTAEKTTEKTAEKSGQKKENLASTLFKFETHQDAKYKDRRYNDRGFKGDRRAKAPHQPRYDGDNNANNASKPVVNQQDFPALGLHGSDPVKA